VGAGYDRALVFAHLAALGGFDRRVWHRLGWVEGGYLAVSDVLTGRLATLDGLDAIVAIEPRSAVLIPGLEEHGLPHTRIVAIGDAFAPRTIDAAIFEAVELAYDIAGMATLRG
jgi:hypothetical protein